MMSLFSGKVWRKHRKMATPAYNKKSVEYFTPIINAEAEQLGRDLSRKDPNVSFDVYEDVVKYTTQSVNRKWTFRPLVHQVMQN